MLDQSERSRGVQVLTVEGRRDAIDESPMPELTFSSPAMFLTFRNLGTLPQLRHQQARCQVLHGVDPVTSELHMYMRIIMRLFRSLYTNSTAGEDHPDTRHGSSRAEGPVLSASFDGWA